ncbi:hypothetical protein JOB18_019357 [Solea senegalensis]|uniref:Endonuclease/exonuclease/phosphatase domain-containing protein n=1 Tax=Solea senegalensis TaxID=28829 RepID=A0AAV6R0C4_SOLSE|nr:hypothetical protein JOB18_019357 [Solea senegalensis]
MALGVAVSTLHIGGSDMLVVCLLTRDNSNIRQHPEHGAGYTLYWSGKGKDESGLSGVGFMIKTSIANKLLNLPVRHSDHCMSLRQPLHEDKFATLISAYAPTHQADTLTKEAFYSELRNLLSKVNVVEKVLVIGDFNAGVGTDSDMWPGYFDDMGFMWLHSGNCTQWKRDSENWTPWKQDSGNCTPWKQDSGNCTQWKRDSGNWTPWKQDSGNCTQWKRDSGNGAQWKLDTMETGHNGNETVETGHQWKLDTMETRN